MSYNVQDAAPPTPRLRIIQPQMSIMPSLATTSAQKQKGCLGGDVNVSFSGNFQNGLQVSLWVWASGVNTDPLLS